MFSIDLFITIPFKLISKSLSLLISLLSIVRASLLKSSTSLLVAVEFFSIDSIISLIFLPSLTFSQLSPKIMAAFFLNALAFLSNCLSQINLPETSGIPLILDIWEALFDWYPSSKVSNKSPKFLIISLTKVVWYSWIPKWILCFWDNCWNLLNILYCSAEPCAWANWSFNVLEIWISISSVFFLYCSWASIHFFSPFPVKSKTSTFVNSK